MWAFRSEDSGWRALRSAREWICTGTGLPAGSLGDRGGGEAACASSARQGGGDESGGKWQEMAKASGMFPEGNAGHAGPGAMPRPKPGQGEGKPAKRWGPSSPLKKKKTQTAKRSLSPPAAPRRGLPRGESVRSFHAWTDRRPHPDPAVQVRNGTAVPGGPGPGKGHAGSGAGNRPASLCHRRAKPRAPSLGRGSLRSLPSPEPGRGPATPHPTKRTSSGHRGPRPGTETGSGTVSRGRP